MVEHKKETEQIDLPELKPVGKEHNPSGWIQKYLDLADLLMRRRKQKRDNDRPKAA